MNPRVAGCDDGRVDKRFDYTILTCVFYEGYLPVDVKMGLVKVDGFDATSILAGLLGYGVDVVFLDTIVYAGFNIVSIPGLARLTGSNIIAFYPYKPSYERLARPIEQHLSKPGLRLKLLEQVRNTRSLYTPRGEVYSIDTFDDESEVLDWIVRYQFFSPIPEPLRVAHMIASQFSKLLFYHSP